MEGYLYAVIENYESEHYKWDNTSAVQVLKLLMEEHGLNQNGLPEIGSQGVVSEILKGKRSLNVKQIQKLSKRFKVNPSIFFD